MRQHAQARLAQALQSNTQLDLDASQQQAGAETWEASLFQSSNSKSAYLSKLSNAAAEIKRAEKLAEVDRSHVRWTATPDKSSHAATGSLQAVP